MTHYIVSKTDFEYNDEGYNQNDGGFPVHVATSMENAKKWMYDQMVTDAKNGNLYMIEGKYLEGTNLERFIELFGEECLSIESYNSRKYAYIDNVPNLNHLSEEKIVEFFEIVECDLYFITEVN